MPCASLVIHPHADAAGSIWAIDVPTWITAVGTAILAVFAIVTAIYAINAFRAQSKEVSGQAEMLKVQSDQLAEQRRINYLQARDLQESLTERERLRRIAEREQANDVGFAWWSVSLSEVPCTDVCSHLHTPARSGAIVG